MTDKYTLVRHTGYSQTDHAEFAQAVEERSVTSAVARKIELAGGVSFPDYGTASDAAEAVNYPPGVSGLVPQAKGKFKRIPDFGEEIYVPDLRDLTSGRLS